MSASHDAHEPHEIHPHPPMPAVHDEAADSPVWLPVVGASLVLLMVLGLLLRSAMQPPAPEPTLDEAPAAAPSDAPAE